MHGAERGLGALQANSPTKPTSWVLVTVWRVSLTPEDSRILKANRQTSITDIKG